MNNENISNANSENNFQKAYSYLKLLKYPLFILLSIISFYVIILIAINQFIRQEDKSFKNIYKEIKRLLSSFAMQFAFLCISIFFGLLSSVPLTYIASKKGNLFANIILIIIITFIAYFYVKRIIKAYKENKKITEAIAALFPTWFKIIFWVVFTLYFLPFTIGIAHMNIFIGIFLFFFAAFLVNVIFYIDKLTNYFKSKKDRKHVPTA